MRWPKHIFSQAIPVSFPMVGERLHTKQYRNDLLAGSILTNLNKGFNKI